jgi:S-adenosylmethionine/arginine decarboxylase-like enzyme
LEGLLELHHSHSVSIPASGYWGFHALIDCGDCSREAITNPETLRMWVKDLVERIQMVPYGEPQILHFGHNEVHLEGWTVIQLIETSNIIAHFNDHTGEGYIDVFSCKPYDIDVAINTIKEYFAPKTIRTNFLTRQA